MKSVMMLSANGKLYTFDASDFSFEDKEAIKKISHICTQECIQAEMLLEEDIKLHFVNKVASELGVELSPIAISFVVAVDGVLF